MIFRAGAAATRVDVTDDHLVLDCAMPCLAGTESQILAHGELFDGGGDGWLLRGADTLAGVLLGNGGALADESCQLYRQMFAITRGLNRYRIWNYVPRINAMVDGVENYVAFNAGRHRAFAEQFGNIAAQDLSAASAVGVAGGPLAVAFVAGSDPVRNYENPLQTPASRYPARYGENAPLFARGSKVHATDGRTCWHLSGTASIRESETIGSDFARQFHITLENITGLLADMAVPAVRQAAWKIFLRDRKDLGVCQQLMAAAYPEEVPQMVFLEADICRSDLLLEIEGVFHQVPP